MVVAWALAIQFLTRIPVPVQFIATDRQLGQSVLFYPLVGLIIGALLWLLAGVLPETGLGAAVLLCVWVLITGGLHLDGLADCADAWIGGIGDKSRTIAIMKDPSAGPSAVVILTLLLLLKWSAILALVEQQKLLPLLFIPVLGRTAILAMMLTTPYVSPGGLAEKLLANLSKQTGLFILLVTVWITVYVLGIVPFSTAAGVFVIVRYWTLQRLDGATGDVYGALVELVEMATLIAVVMYE